LIFFILASQNKKTGAGISRGRYKMFFLSLRIVGSRGVPGVDQAGMGRSILKKQTTGQERTRGERIQAVVKSNLNLQGSPCGFVLNLNKRRSHIKQKTILSRFQTR
jgi:hypothetical protein